MSLTEAIKLAYAANPAGETIIETIELDHVTFAAPIRVACNVHEDIDLPPADGEPAVTFTALGVDVTLTGVDDDGPTEMRVRMDLVQELLLPYLEDAVAATAPFEVTYRAYTSLDLSKPGDVISGLQLKMATLTATSAEATVTYPEIETQAFPLRTYDATSYPALTNG